MSLSLLMSCCTWSRLHALISDSFILLLYSFHVVSLFDLNWSLDVGFVFMKLLKPLQHFKHILIGVFEDDLCFWLISVVLVFVVSPVVEPVSIMIVIIPVLVALISLVIPLVQLVFPVSVVVSAVSLSVA